MGMEVERKREYKILKLATLAGQIVLQSGGEVYRVEETVCRVGKNYDLHIECFATLTCIMTSLGNKHEEVIAKIDRIKSRSNSLHRIHRVNALVRNIEEYSLEKLEEELIEIQNIKSYPFVIDLFGNVIGAAFFVPLFSGGIRDMIVAGIGGFIISSVMAMGGLLKLNSFFTNVVGGAVCSLVAYIFYNIGFIQHSDVPIVIISILMLLVPGVSFINSLRDVISGDLVAATSRLTEVVMIGMALAVGAGIALKLLMNFGGITI